MNTFHQGLSALVAQHAGRLPCDALMRAAESLISTEESVPAPLIGKCEFTVDKGAYRCELEKGHSGACGSTTTSRFLDLDDSVKDNQTGLIWAKQTLGAGKLDFKDAEKAVADLRLDGVGGWRLPTVRELLTIVDYERHDPAIDPIFECKGDWYWTASPAAFSPSDGAWFVSFSSGGALWFSRDHRAFVRAVRPSQ